MSRFTDILQGVVHIKTDEHPPDIIPVESIPYKIDRTGENYKHIIADGEMTEADLLKACEYKAGYVLFGIAYNGKIVYEVRRGIPRLD